MIPRPLEGKAYRGQAEDLPVSAKIRATRKGLEIRARLGRPFGTLIDKRLLCKNRDSGTRTCGEFPNSRIPPAYDIPWASETLVIPKELTPTVNETVDKDLK
jgi:hypothetical protein